MVQKLTCPKCGYCTKQIGHYNRHVKKSGGCKRKEVEHCAHCQKAFAVNSSGLTKHACLARCAKKVVHRLNWFYVELIDDYPDYY